MILLKQTLGSPRSVLVTPQNLGVRSPSILEIEPHNFKSIRFGKDYRYCCYSFFVIMVQGDDGLETLLKCLDS